MHLVRFCFVHPAVAVLLSFGSALAQESGSPAVSARQALVEARAVAAQATGKKGSERIAALDAGAAAFEKVAEAFAVDLAVAAEASFEAAELWRRKGALAEAERAYRAALANDSARYEARASFEVAHLLRRGKQPDAAVELYRKVATLQPGSARAQSALLWCGRTMQASGRVDDAVAAFEIALQSASEAAAIITAGNWLAKAKIRRGDLEGARTVLGDVEKRTAGELAADTPAAKRLQTALADMSARKALQRGIDKKTGATEDAADLESDGDEETEKVDAKENGGRSKPVVKKRG
jgi:tetratricopeptide (TPR) repeat protein